MQLKRYRGKTLKDALRAVRQDLGPDALVLSTQVVQDRGPRGWLGGTIVEIAAAVERRDRPDVSALRHTVNEPSDRELDALAARLGGTGLEPWFARAVAASHPADQRRTASAANLHVTLASQLESLAAPDEDFAPVEVFVGPPGAGKTTTIAKIAAQQRSRQGRRLGLVAADGYRVGAVEQLRLYAEVIGAPLTVARSVDELGDALAAARRPLLIDTPGRSPGDDVSREMFRLVGRQPGVRTHLVLPANLPPGHVRRTLDRFHEARPSRIVITKLDEADSLAPLVGVLREAALPISFVGTGQRVPEDLHRATPPAIAAWVLGEHHPEGATA
jgi:flagellar biosynthesis protein FlhF